MTPKESVYLWLIPALPAFLICLCWLADLKRQWLAAEAARRALERSGRPPSRSSSSEKFTYSHLFWTLFLTFTPIMNWVVLIIYCCQFFRRVSAMPLPFQKDKSP